MDPFLYKDKLKSVSLPPPPPLPKYDPEKEPSKWNHERLIWNLPVDRTNWPPIGTQPESADKPDWRGVIKNNVIELPLPGPYKFGQPANENYFWFDTPDYADPFKKLWYSFKWFSTTGLAYLCIVGMWEGGQFSVKNNMNLARRFTIPWLFGGMAASFSVLLLSNIRGNKDDYYNYAAAGLVMSSILGRKNHITWWRHSVVLTPAALTVKYCAETNTNLYPNVNFRALYRNSSLGGNDGEHGISSGDLRMGIRATNGEPGRDVRTPY